MRSTVPFFHKGGLLLFINTAFLLIVKEKSEWTRNWLLRIQKSAYKSGFVCLFVCLIDFWRDNPQWARTSSFMRFLDHPQRRTTVGSTPLDEWSARLRGLYLTTHNTHNRQTSLPPVGFEPTIPAGERPQTYALDHVATGTGYRSGYFLKSSGCPTLLNNRSENQSPIILLCFSFFVSFPALASLCAAQLMPFSS